MGIIWQEPRWWGTREIQKQRERQRTVRGRSAGNAGKQSASQKLSEMRNGRVVALGASPVPRSSDSRAVLQLKWPTSRESLDWEVSRIGDQKTHRRPEAECMSGPRTQDEWRNRPELTEDEKRLAAKALEDKRWAEAEAIYARCKDTMERIWKDALDAAVEAQRNLAETMRDRTYVAIQGDIDHVVMDRSIPVPLFTPRDRVQFLKEATVAFFIAADKRNLTVTPEPVPESLDELPAALMVAPDEP